MKLLIADDDPATCSLLTTAVKQFGHESLTVLDGDSAWAALEKDRFDVLITGWLLPGSSGIELIRKLREKLPEPYLYVVLLTGQDGKEDMRDGPSAGADDCLTKPCDSRDLAIRLRTAGRAPPVTSVTWQPRRRSIRSTAAASSKRIRSRSGWSNMLSGGNPFRPSSVLRVNSVITRPRPLISRMPGIARVCGANFSSTPTACSIRNTSSSRCTARGSGYGSR